MPSLLRVVSTICVTVCLVAAAPLGAQVPAPRKRLLVIGEEKGYRHEAVTHAMVTIERLGKETGLWDTVIRTDTEALTKKKRSSSSTLTSRPGRRAERRRTHRSRSAAARASAAN